MTEKSPPISPHETSEQVLVADEVEGLADEGEEEVHYEPVEDLDVQEGQEVIDVEDG